MVLNAKQIMAAPDLATTEVHVPEWATADGDDTILVGTLGALPRARLQDWVQTLGRPIKAKSERIKAPIVESCDTPPEQRPDAEADEQADEESGEVAEKEYSLTENFMVMVRWCAECILDPKTRLPAFGEKQMEVLGRKSATALKRVYDAALDLNLMSEEATEETAKNSEGTTGDGSGSG